MTNDINFTSIRDILRWMVTTFNNAKITYGHGTENALDEAIFLLSNYLNLPYDKFEIFLDSRLSKLEIENIFELIKKRTIHRIPAPYIAKESWLFDYNFFVDERVIVPRSHLADVLINKLNLIVEKPSLIKNGLDLCTGSGCLGIIMANVFNNAMIDCIDVSEDAIDVAKINVKLYNLNQRIKIIKSDLFLEINEKKYDIIVANPPYIDSKLAGKLPPEYNAEPEISLFSADDGLSLIKKIIINSSKHLAENGILLMEIGANKKLIEEAFPSLALMWIDTKNSSNTVFFAKKSLLSDI